MSLLAQQVAMVSSAIAMRASRPTAEVARQKGETQRGAILAVIQKHGPIGETEISSRSGINRTTVHHHLLAMERGRQIKRASEEPRAPWIVANPVCGRIITFETAEDCE